MFCLDLQEDGSYVVLLPDNSKVHLPAHPGDTIPIRRELAKLAHRIATREFIYTDKKFLTGWSLNINALTEDQLENLIEIYSDIVPENEVWKELSEYEDDVCKKVSELEREILKEYELVMKLKRERDDKKIPA